MRVKWSELQNIDYMDPPDNFHTVVARKFEGEVVGTIRAWGITTFVVMLNDGTVREVAASLVTKAVEGFSREF